MLLWIQRTIQHAICTSIRIRIGVSIRMGVPICVPIRTTHSNLFVDIDLAQIASIASLHTIISFRIARTILLHGIQLRQTRQFLVRDAQQNRVVRRSQRVARFRFRGEEGIGIGLTGRLERENELNARLDVFAMALNRQIHVIRREAHADQDV